MVTKFNHDFSYIDREDTNNYTPDDILQEVKEWSYILTECLHFEEAYRITECRISTRAKNFLAQTGRRRSSITGFISINSDFLKHHINSNIFHSVLCHETIHTLKDCFNHQAPFKSVGYQVMARFPNIMIRRCLTDAGYIKYINTKESQKVKPWKVVCKGCGSTIEYNRSCDIIKNPQRYKCAKCGGKFEVFHIENGMEVKYIHIAV